MAGDSIGRLFRITNWGESHGKAIGIVVEGCPSLIELSEKDIQKELDRRKPGQSRLTTARAEDDKVEILSGVFNGKTTGAPISMMIRNKDYNKKDYAKLSKVFRPSHADFTYFQKYRTRDAFGGGRSSARLTAGNVAAGAIAKKVLRKIEIVAYVKKINNITAEVDVEKVKAKDVESTIVRCPDSIAAARMIKLVEETKKSGDSVGGVVECVIRNVPPGLGEPLFDKLSADLAKAMMSINATKGFEIGSGFSCAEMLGSKHNDEFVMKNKKIVTKTNNSGGIQGGITNGMLVVFRVAFKPTPTISKRQKTVSTDGKVAFVEGTGRHDPCVLPRAVPVVEAMTAIVLCDHYLRSKAMKNED
ncbi:chorismate synthase [Candidatus Woesearchaeota archaeon]|nr:chorismate synthase [Candidatus Woesearchaeota archaeon]